MLWRYEGRCRTTRSGSLQRAKRRMRRLRDTPTVTIHNDCSAQIPVIRRGLAEPVNSTRTGLSPGMAVWCWLPLVGVIARLKDKGRPEGGLLPCSSD
jgi:hypothetical protein